MTDCTFNFPCSPGDTVYLLASSGVVCTVVTQIQLIMSQDGKVNAYICFSNFPFITLEEASKYMFSTYSEAISALERMFNRRK